MILVCSLKDLETVCESIQPSHVISVIDPGYAPKTPKGVEHHLKLGFDDIVEISSFNNLFRDNLNIVPQTLPNQIHIDSIIQFSKLINPEDNVVVHCWCGVSRSMATATYLLCRQNLNNIDRNIRYIRSVAPHANPNKLMIRLFEEKLNINNKISEAYNAYPYTKAYDCSSNFAPITLFNIKEMREFE